MERLQKVGSVRVFSSAEVTTSAIGIGFEKLDRDAFDPANAYDPVAAIGVKWVRLQSGWAKTEKQKGVYDFAWLDDVVDNLILRGLQPWICLCYGNALYTPEAKNTFGAVGHAPVHTEEERNAWHRYVATLTAHYHGKVQWYEVWNEPDNNQCWKPGRNGTEYGEFVKVTAKAIKEGDPDAKVIGGSHCASRLNWLNDVLATGAADAMDALTYHGYSPDELSGACNRVNAIIALCHAYKPNLKIIQGETGAQSSSAGAGAMHGASWTPLKQAKFLARHMISDFFHDIMFSSYFSALDMIEALCGTVDNPDSYKDFGYFGVLSAQFDENGRGVGTFTPKPSYRALATIASIFQGTFKHEDLPVLFLPDNSPQMMAWETNPQDIVRGGFRKPNGSCAIAYWKQSELLTSTYDGTITAEVAQMPQPMRLIDIITGDVFALPESMMEQTGETTWMLHHLPLLDAPLLLTFGDFATVTD